jgi:glycosyltransferase involved in cell wall biosynthesis
MIRWRLRQSLTQFDLVHHLTFNSFLVPGIWWGISRPLILGPLGGGQICPPALLPLFGAGRVIEWLRSTLIRASQWSPIHRFNCHRANLILAANQDTARQIPAAAQPKLRLLLETAIAPLPVGAPPHSRSADNSVRLLWVGRLEKRKALPLALRALAKAMDSGLVIRLTVVGIGPDEKALKELSDELGLAAQVDWLGRCPRDEVDQLMANHDVFLFTSVRDTSGNVLLEAMRAGLPVITLNHQGAAEMTTDQTAIRVTPTTLAETVQGLASACCALAGDPERRRRLGQAGREHVLQFHTWEQRVAQMNVVYNELAAQLRRG